MKFVALIFAVCFGSACANAGESAAQAMKQFGLVGTWSDDCAANGTRQTFEYPAGSNPTIRIEVSDPTANVRTVIGVVLAEVTSAVRETEDNLMMTVVITSDGSGSNPNIGQPFSSRYERAGTKFRHGATTLEKCGD